MKNEFVSYLNTLHHASGCNEHAIAENNVSEKDCYSRQLKFEREISKKLLKIITAEDGRVVILTGHAGDGKTSILQTLVEKCSGKQMNGNDLEGDIILQNQKHIHYVKDMSEHEREKQISIVKEAFMAQKRKESVILISNTGPLFNVLQELGIEEEKIIKILDTKTLEEDLFSIEGVRDVPVLVANLALFDNSDIIEKYIEKMINPALWEPCIQCEKKEYCPIYFNQNIIRKNKKQIIEFSRWYYRWNFEHGERFTVRQMIAHIAYSFTGNLNCKGIVSLVGNRNLKRKLYHSYSNLFFGYHYEKGKSVQDKNALQIRPIELLQKQCLDLRKIPEEYELFVQNKFYAFDAEVEKLVGLCWKEFAALGEEKKQEKRECFQVIKRAYYMYHTKGQEENEKIMRAVFSEVFVKYSEIQNRKMVPGSVKAYIRRLTFHALQLLFTGLAAEETDRIYLTVKRKGDIPQNVQIVQGYVNRDEIEIKFEDFTNVMNGKIEKIIVLECKNQRAELTLPMLEYFYEITNGMIQTKIDPRLSQGVENIKAKIFKAGRKTSQDAITMIYSNGNKFNKIELHLEEDKLFVE